MPIQSDMVGCLLGRVESGQPYIKINQSTLQKKVVQQEGSYKQYILCCKNNIFNFHRNRERERGGFQTVGRSIIKLNGDQRVRGWSKRNNNRGNMLAKFEKAGWKLCLRRIISFTSRTSAEPFLAIRGLCECIWPPSHKGAPKRYVQLHMRRIKITCLYL